MTDCVILAGGLGSRMRPLTESVSKALIHRSDTSYVDGRVELYDKFSAGEDLQYVDYGLLVGFEVQSRFYDVGSPGGLAEVEKYLAGLSTPGEVVSPAAAGCCPEGDDLS